MRCFLLLSAALALFAPAAPLLAVEGNWRILGPDGGQVNDLVFQPGSSQVLYAAVQGGIYKSRDAGATWTWVGAGLYSRAQVLNVAVDPVHPETVYTTQGDRVLKSVNGGLSWRSSGLFGTYQVAVHPRSPGTVFAATIRGIFRSSDRGVTWSRLSRGLPESYRATLIAFDPFVERRLYAWIQEEPGAPVGVLVRSADGGATWEALPHGPQGNQRIYSLAIDPRSPGTLYAGTEKAVYKSVDGGLSWKPTPLGAVGFVATLKVHPRLGTVYAGTSTGLFRSADGGASWRRLSRGLEGDAVFALVFSPDSARTVYAGVDTILERGGVFKSGDGGASWRFSGRGISALFINSIAVNPDNPDTLWVIGGTVPFKSTDRGKTWTRVRPGPGDGRATQVAVDPHDGSTVYLLLPDGTLRRTHDGGQTWESAGDPGTSSSGYGRVVIDPRVPATLYVAGLGIARSADGGATWTKSPGEPADLVFYDLALAPSAPATLYGTGAGGAGGSRVLRTLDGGATWTRRQEGLPSSLLDLAVDPLISTTVYGTTFDGTIYKTADGGGTWSVFSDAFRDGTVLLATSPFTSGLLYAGVGFDNVYEIPEGGAWEPLGNSPSAGYATLAFDPRDPCRLYAGTYGRGLLAFTRTGTAACP
jgi:photosystem II stability/assembly factor-like uncharacterized protein